MRDDVHSQRQQNQYVSGRQSLVSVYLHKPEKYSFNAWNLYMYVKTNVRVVKLVTTYDNVFQQQKARIAQGIAEVIINRPHFITVANCSDNTLANLKENESSKPPGSSNHLDGSSDQ